MGLRREIRPSARRHSFTLTSSMLFSSGLMPTRSTLESPVWISSGDFPVSLPLPLTLVDRLRCLALSASKAFCSCHHRLSCESCRTPSSSPPFLSFVRELSSTPQHRAGAASMDRSVLDDQWKFGVGDPVWGQSGPFRFVPVIGWLQSPRESHDTLIFAQ